MILKIRFHLILKVSKIDLQRCYNKRFALKCIELSKYCPHLINLCLPNSNGITPFHRVCYRGNYCLIDFMIDNGKIYC